MRGIFGLLHESISRARKSFGEYWRASRRYNCTRYLVQVPWCRILLDHWPSSVQNLFTVNLGNVNPPFERSRRFKEISFIKYIHMVTNQLGWDMSIMEWIPTVQHVCRLTEPKQASNITLERRKLVINICRTTPTEFERSSILSIPSCTCCQAIKCEPWPTYRNIRPAKFIETLQD
jgi:hypothetical protein